MERGRGGFLKGCKGVREGGQEMDEEEGDYR